MIPSTPQPGTGLTDALVTPDQYVSLTGDDASDPEAVSAAITDGVHPSSVKPATSAGASAAFGV